MHRIIFRAAIVGVALASFAHWQRATAQDDLPPLTPQRSYNGIVAGEEAYQMNEARRRGEIGRQLDLNADMYWRWSGAGSYYPGVFEPWPMVPGNIWGWPAAVQPPTYSPVRVSLPAPTAQQWPPTVVRRRGATNLAITGNAPAPAPGDNAPPSAVPPPPPPGFVPAAEPEYRSPSAPGRRNVPAGQREF